MRSSLRWLLWPLCFPYWLVIKIRENLYKYQLKKTYKFNVPILCVGNLSTGGTGKTPWVEELVRAWSAREDKAIAVLSRGYGGDYNGVLAVSPFMDPRTCGEEALWLKKKLQTDVYISRSRARAAAQAIKQSSPGGMVLDDGFQHLALARDVNVVILDATAPRSSYHLLPLGRMRETFSALKRADLVIINKCNWARPDQLSWLSQRCAPFISESHIYHADYLFKSWVPLFDMDHPLPPPPCAVALTTAIGNPQAFMSSVLSQGFELSRTFIYPDHHYWMPRDIDKIIYQMKSLQLSHLLVTEKDAIKLERYHTAFVEAGIQAYSAHMQVSLGREQEKFYSHCFRLLDRAGTAGET
jgi:tetraacyldisaccharide 4'-kinase